MDTDNIARRDWRAAFRTGMVVLVCGAFAGCAAEPVAPYQPSFDNVQILKAGAKAQAGVDAFTGGEQKISIRGHGAISPAGHSFGDYVQDALSGELKKAELLLPASALRVKGNVAETDIDAAASTGTATITVEFTVSKAGVEKYRKSLSAKYQWDSSFVGAIAIPRAYQSYPKVVEALLKQLYSDPDFQKALM